jgi:N utilization substance protein A
MRGSRVQAVVNELQGEKVDIVPWSEDAAAFIVNGLGPAEVAKVVLDEDTQRIEVVVPDDQLSLAIGRRGQNVRLASQLSGWDIDILTEAEESERRQAEFAERTQIFMASLDVDEMIAQLLTSEGFATIEEVAYVPLDEITVIEGFDDETAEELQRRATELLDRQNQALDEERKALGVADELMNVEGLTPAMLVALGKNDVFTLEDFAGCVPDDLTGWYESVDRQRVRQPGIFDDFDVSADEAQKMIMNTRVMVGWITEEDLLVPEDEAPEDGGDADSSEGKPSEASAEDVFAAPSEPTTDTPTE